MKMKAVMLCNNLYREQIAIPQYVNTNHLCQYLTITSHMKEDIQELRIVSHNI